MNRDVIIALDFDNEQKLDEFINLFKDKDCFVKVGMELYYQYGPQIIEKLKANGFKIFLDLKLHDIPNTVIKTMKVLSKLNIEIVNLHATVGSYAMKEVSKIFENSNTIVIAVTCLTSTDQEMLKTDLCVNQQIDDYVIHLASITKESGIDGVVCSPLEVVKIKQLLGSEFVCVTPGIRYESGTDDQKRITTPSEARTNGSDYIVVGRLITNSENPVHMYDKIKSEFLGA